MDCKKCCQNDFSAFKEATMFHANLYACLYELFNTKKHIVCGLINVEYNYSHKDWFTGKNISYRWVTLLIFTSKKRWIG